MAKLGLSIETKSANAIGRHILKAIISEEEKDNFLSSNTSFNLIHYFNYSLIANKIHTLNASISYFLEDLLAQTRPYRLESKEYDQNAQCNNYVP